MATADPCGCENPAFEVETPRCYLPVLNPKTMDRDSAAAECPRCGTVAKVLMVTGSTVLLSPHARSSA